MSSPPHSKQDDQRQWGHDRGGDRRFSAAQDPGRCRSNFIADERRNYEVDRGEGERRERCRERQGNRHRLRAWQTKSALLDCPKLLNLWLRMVNSIR